VGKKLTVEESTQSWHEKGDSGASYAEDQLQTVLRLLGLHRIDGAGVERVCHMSTRSWSVSGEGIMIWCDAANQHKEGSAA
jgi:hypothetical protein